MRASSVDQIILDTLSREHTHMTPAQVYEEIRHHLPAVNQSTVYRALERLVSHGKVSVSDMGTGAAVYERLAGEPHHHFVCQQCGQVMNLRHEEIQHFFEGLEKKNHIAIATNHLILFGTCEQCSGKDRNEPAATINKNK